METKEELCPKVKKCGKNKGQKRKKTTERVSKEILLNLTWINILETTLRGKTE